MRMNFDQLAAELTALPEEKLAKVKGGDDYSGNFGNEYFTGTNWHSGGGGGYYYYTPGSTTTTQSGPNWNSSLGTWSSVNYGGSTTTTSSGYWSYVPSGYSNGGGGYNSGGGGYNSGGGGTTTGGGTSNTAGIVNDPSHALEFTTLRATAELTALESQLANHQLGASSMSEYQDYHNALTQLISEIAGIRNSGINVRVEYGSKPDTHYDTATGEIVMVFEQGVNPLLQIGVNSHEIHHVTEYLQGQLSFDKVTGTAGALADITDEIACYQLQHVLDRGLNADSFDLMGNPIANAHDQNSNYLVSAADVIAFGNANSIPDYALLKQTETNIHTPANGNTPAPIDNLLFTDYFIYH